MDSAKVYGMSSKNHKGKGSTLLKASEEKPYSKPWKSSDLVLSVKDRKFHVHRTLLTVASQVFERMFTSDFKEKSAREIELPEKKAGDIEQLLNFIYPDKDFILSKENCFSLFKLANEYQIERLMEECQKFLSDWSDRGMGEDEAMEATVLSQMFPLEEETVRLCMNIIATGEHKTWQEIKQHRLFAQLKPETVQHLMEKRIAYFEFQQNVGNSRFTRVQSFKKGPRLANRSRFFNF